MVAVYIGSWKGTEHTKSEKRSCDYLQKIVKIERAILCVKDKSENLWGESLRKCHDPNIFFPAFFLTLIRLSPIHLPLYMYIFVSLSINHIFFLSLCLCLSLSVSKNIVSCMLPPSIFIFSSFPILTCHACIMSWLSGQTLDSQLWGPLFESACCGCCVPRARHVILIA